MIKAISLIGNLKLSLTLISRISTRQQFSEKLAKKKYREILGISDDRQNLFKDKDLHRAYLNQVKKFHSDNVQSVESKKEFEEITKCIIAAYDELKKEDQNYKQSTRSETVIFHDEEEVAQQIFGKSYNEVKYNMYAPGNQEMRTKFLEELEKKKKIARDRDYQQKPQSSPASSAPPRHYAQTSTVQASSDGSMMKFLALAVACGLLCIPFFNRKAARSDESSVPKKQNKVRQYSDKDYDIMQLNSKKILMKPYEQFYNSILKRRPHMLHYPTGKDPHVLDQLTKYSIAPDIHLYEVSSKYFVNPAQSENLLKANTTADIEKYELTETKPNTLLTLSLEAERALQNIYVKADDVVSEIKEKGKFTPPKILFKFHGYIMFQIRNKPFSTLQCYRNTKYISLFDLYFDYYSPIFFKRDHFRQYLTGFYGQSPLKNNRYFGNVYLNHRSIPKKYLEKGEKIVIMKEVKKAFQPSGSLKRYQQTFRTDWEGYYARFQKNWKKYCAHQKQGQFKY